MQLRLAVVCDHAEVREGLLTVVSSGVTRLWRSELPGPLGVMVALQVELDAAERPYPHEIRLVVRAPSGGELAQFRGAVQAGLASSLTDADEGAILSMPIDLRMVGLTEYGWHTFEATFDDMPLATLRVKAAARPEPPQPVPMPNRASRRASRHN